MKYILKKLAVIALILPIALFDSCKKADDPNVLTGNTNIPMTVVGSQTTTYMVVNGTSVPGSTSLTVLRNNNGTVTYCHPLTWLEIQR